MKMKKIILLLLTAVLALSLLASCAGGGISVTHVDPESGTEAPSTDGESAGTAQPLDLTHGVLVGVTYACSGVVPQSENFSYRLSETDDGVYRFEAITYDDEGEPQTTSRDASFDDMARVRSIFERYGYVGLVGERLDFDPDAEDTPGVASYYFSGLYSDGASFSTDSAGEGAAELRQLFEELLGGA